MLFRSRLLRGELELDVVTERLDGAEAELHWTEEEERRQQSSQRRCKGEEGESEQRTAQEPAWTQQVEE